MDGWMDVSKGTKLKLAESRVQTLKLRKIEYDAKHN